MSRRFMFLLCFLSLLFSCKPGDGQAPSLIRQMTVSILPQKFFARRIAGDRWRIQVMIPPAYNPATYEPLPAQLKTLSRSQIYFRIGTIPFELGWMDKLIAVNPTMKVVDTSRDVSLISDSPGHSHAHEEGRPGPEPARHTGIDPHIWLSPRAVRIQINHMTAALRMSDPENSVEYQRNHDAFVQEISALEKELTAIFSVFQSKKILVYHPAWSYFCRDFGLIQIPIQREGKDPSPGDLARLIEIGRSESIRVIFVQRQFDTHQAETVARELDATVVVLDPLAEDWLKNMKRIAETIAATFAGEM